MHRLVVRVTLVAIVLASGAAGAVFLHDIDRQATELTVVEAQLTGRLDRLADAVTGIGVSQQAYIAPGQPDQRSFERMTSLVRQIYDDAAALKPVLRSPGSSSAVQALNAATGDLIAADSRARENLMLGQEAMAADVIFSDGRSTLDAMLQRIRAIRDGERTFYQTRQAQMSRQRWSALGLVVLAWLAALIALVPARRERSVVFAPVAPPEPAQEAAVIAEPNSSSPGLDLAAAADLCTALSRLTTTESLPPLLARAADLLDAPGIILWMGAGEELFAVTAHGYRPDIIARLGPINRAADNATASAWRTGQTTVVAGDRAGNGAIVTPMLGPDACIGALAIELRNGREHDPATAALASMIAAQLSAVVSAWPPASSAPERRAANG
jgi:hypothetical protein